MSHLVDKKLSFSIAPLTLLALLLSVLWSTTGFAQDELLEPWRKDLPALLQESFVRRLDSRKDSLPVLGLVQPVAKQVRDSVVTVFVDGQPVALGTIVHAEGMAITKASELKPGDLRVRLMDRRLLAAKVASVRKTEDLALLKFTANNLTPVKFSATEPKMGSFLVSAGAYGEVLGLGIAGAESRAVAETGVLGVGFSPHTENGVRVTGVLPGSGAAVAGIEVGDWITALNGKPLSNGIALKQEIGQLYPGDHITATIRRDTEVSEVRIEIRDISVVHENESDARVHGARSGRLAGFSRVMQHDTVLEPEQCGGPVADLNGNVVGINIARAGRVCTYLVPSKAMEPIVQSMIQAVSP